MLTKRKKIVVTFFTTSDAMALDKAAKKENLKGELISAPRNLTADCGISFATDTFNRVAIENILSTYNIEYDKIVEIEC